MIPGLASPAPLVHRLPGVLQDDEFTQRFLHAFDDAYAPIITTLDSLACYFDPHLAPPDFVDFLAGWVGVALETRGASSSVEPSSPAPPSCTVDGAPGAGSRRPSASGSAPR